jgi:hypothetical protein
MTPKITLMGRPARIVEHENYVLMSFDFKGAPSLPRGLPVPASTATTYTAFMVKKQWRKVEEALRGNPLDQLIIEGFCTFDDELEDLVVFVQAATTKELQRAKLAEEKAAAAPAVTPKPGPAVDREAAVGAEGRPTNRSRTKTTEDKARTIVDDVLAELDAAEVTKPAVGGHATQARARLSEALRQKVRARLQAFEDEEAGAR